jgi:hypothetical protein
MKRTILLAATLSALVLGLSATAAPVAEWEVYAPEGAAFEIKMPGKPTVSVKKNKTFAGDVTTTMHMAMDDSASATYGAAVVELPAGVARFAEGKPKEMLDGVATGFAAGAGGKVVSQKEIKLGDYQGREFQVSLFDGAGVGYGRAYFVKGKVVMVVVLAPKDADITASRDAYFASLKVK